MNRSCGIPISAAEGTLIVTFAPAIEADLKPSAPVFIPAQRGADGMLSTDFVVGEKGNRAGQSPPRPGLDDHKDFPYQTIFLFGAAMITSKLTRKAQTTIPQAVRNALGSNRATKSLTQLRTDMSF